MGIRECGLWLRHSRMAVAGFDDIVTLRDVSPCSPRCALPLEEVGAQALQLASTTGRQAVGSSA